MNDWMQLWYEMTHCAICGHELAKHDTGADNLPCKLPDCACGKEKRHEAMDLGEYVADSAERVGDDVGRV